MAIIRQPNRGAGNRGSSRRTSPIRSPGATPARISARQKRRVLPARGVDTVNFIMILITALMGVVLWWACSGVYHKLEASMPLTIALVFAIFCAVLSVVILIYSRVDGSYLGNIFSSGAAAAGAILAGILLLAGCAALFQWIYGMDFVENASAPSSYVFVIDDSDSMNQNDAGNERYRSILTVMSDMPADFPYMVYSFTSSARIARNMAPLAAGETLTGTAEGYTDIKAALETVLRDYKNGVWKGGYNPKVLLLSDGYNNDRSADFSSLLNRYAGKGIAISTVGFGDVDHVLMENISSETGGVYIPVSDIANLSEAIRTAVNASSGRDLISARPAVKLDALYAVLRVLFLTLLGLGIGAVSMFAYGCMDNEELILIGSAALSFVGALTLELGMRLGMTEAVARLLYWVLTAVLVCMRKVPYEINWDAAIRSSNQKGSSQRGGRRDGEITKSPIPRRR